MMNAQAEAPPLIVAVELEPAQLRPSWLRPTTIGLVAFTHIAILGGFLWLSLAPVTPLDDVQAVVIPFGETVTETSIVPTPEAAPIVSEQKAVLAAPEPVEHDDPDATEPNNTATAAAAVPDLTLPAPKVESQDAPQVAPERPQPPQIDRTKLETQEAEQRLKKKREKDAKRRLMLKALQRAKAEAHARQHGHAQLGAAAKRAGVQEGTGEAQHMSNAAYAALVSAEINRHKHYPAEARNAGITGRVGVAFTLNAAGSIIAHHITRSSGNSAIDAAVHQMMAASHPPPPPGGNFRGSVTITFDMSH